MSVDPVSLAITVALNAASMAMTASQTIEGPRLTDLSVTVADYGTPVNYFRGRRRFETPCFYAEPIVERKKTRKSKGGKYKEYTYYGTFGVIVADHPVQTYHRVWFDRHLVYDQDSGKNIFQLADGYELSAFMRFYYGSEEQDPDERMLATVEAEEGPDTCPAYLGVSYIFFEDVPLEQIGNRFPQVSVEASYGGLPDYPTETIALSHFPTYIRFSPDFSQLLLSDKPTFSIIDVPSISVIGTANYSPPWHTGHANAGQAFLEDGSILAAHGDVSVYGSDGIRTSQYPAISNSPRGVVGAADANGTVHWMTIGLYAMSNTIYDGAELDLADFIPAAPVPSSIFCDLDGAMWMAAEYAGDVFFYRLSGGGPGPGLISILGLPGTGNVAAVHYRDADVDHFVFHHGNFAIYAVDRITGLVTISDTSPPYPVEDDPQRWANQKLGRLTMWMSFYEVSLKDLSLVRYLPATLWGSGVGDARTNYDPRNNALIVGGSLSATWFFLDRTQADSVTLAEILRAVAQQADADASDHDFSALTQLVPGHSWTQGVAKDAAKPLLELWDSDVYLSGFQLIGRQRNVPLAGPALDAQYFVRRESEPLYRVRPKAETDLPRRVYMVFADTNAEQQSNTAQWHRNASAVKTRRELSYDMTSTALSPELAQELVVRRGRRAWIGSVEVSQTSEPGELRYEPTDTRNLILDGEPFRGRIVRQTIRADRSIETLWERDGAVTISAVADAEGNYVPDWTTDTGSGASDLPVEVGAEAAGRPEPTVYDPAPSRTFVLDIPLVTDAHDQSTPFLYVAGGPTEEGPWPGADIWHSDSGAETSYGAGWDGIAAGEESVWGTVGGTLGPALATVIDEASSIYVEIPTGTLESISDTEFANDSRANLALIGEEIVQFRDAVLQSGGGYVVSHFARGVQGTEQHIGTHAAGERFILLTAALRRHDVGAGEIGDTDYYKGATFGRNVTAVTPDVIEFSAAANKPLSPCHVELHRDDVTNDWEIEWRRRTRIGGATLNGQDVPLGETYEAYRVKIVDPYSGLPIRTIDVEEPLLVYTQAQQNEDFGAVQTSLWVIVVQMSPALSLEGFPAEAMA